MEKTLNEVNERLRRAEEKRKRYAEREKVLRKKAAELTVKARTGSAPAAECWKHSCRCPRICRISQNV